MQQDAWQPHQKGTICFDDVEESRSDGSNWRDKSRQLRMEREQQPPGARLVSRKVYVTKTLGGTCIYDVTTRMDDAASHIGDATHANGDTN